MRCRTVAATPPAMAKPSPVDYAGNGWTAMLSDDEAKLRDSARDERHLHDGASTTSEAEPIPSSNHQAIDSLGTARQTSPASNPSASSDSSDEPIGKWLKFWRGVLHI